jgi:hypothetical protein
MRVLSYLFFLTAVFYSCSSQKSVSSSENATPTPVWVQSRPITNSYYVGIGVAQKTQGTDFRSAAKENALSDLASEIKVNVNSNSLLYTLEREYKFEQEFRETIRTSTNLDLEDFQLVEQWDDADAYWVYYRLDKSAYAEKQRQKKESAESLALDFLSKAEAAKADGRYSESIDYYLRGLQGIEEFWADNNEATFRGQTILLDNELFGGLKSMLDGVILDPSNKPILTFQNSYRTQAELSVTDSESGQPLSGVPLNYVYQGQYGRIKGSLSTNVDGRITIPIAEAERSTKPNMLSIEIDTEQLFEPFQGDRFMRKLTESLRGRSISSLIEYMPPLVHIDGDERNLGKKMSGEPVAAAIIASLNRKGVRFTEDPKKADVILELKSDTKSPGEAQGFSTVRMELDANVIDAQKNESVYKISKTDIKGVDLTFEKAGLKAYQNFTKNIESELMRKLANDLF